MQTMTASFPLPPVQFQFAGFSWPRRVAMLPRGSVAIRLERYRRPVCGPYYVAPKPGAPGVSFYFGSDFAPGLRFSYADEISGAGIRHTGWFCDDYQGQTIRGIVARLTRGRGFLAGWTMGESMVSDLDTTSIYDDETEAARAADSLAESAAEAQREYEASQQTDDETEAA